MVYSQVLNVHKNDGTVLTITLSLIDSITFTSALPPPSTCPGIPTVNYSGKTYNTIQIGTQCWLKENLDIGTRINASQFQSNNGTIEKYCYDDNPSNCTTYGGLYQWWEAIQYSSGGSNVRGICPAGWHIPTIGELQTLSNSVGGSSNALKAIGQGSGAGVGTNSSGFSALLAGYHNSDGHFYTLNGWTYYWSTTDLDSIDTQYTFIFYSTNTTYFGIDYKGQAVSVRCIKD